MHWTGAHGSAGSVNALIAANPDPVSGEPAFKHGTVTLRRVDTIWHAVAVLRTPVSIRPDVGAHAVWSRTPRSGDREHVRFRGFAPLPALRSAASLAACLLDLPETADMVEYADPGRFVFRIAAIRAGVLAGVLHVAPADVALPTVEALESLFLRSSRPEASALLVGRDSTLAAPAGRLVCVCHQVTEPVIRAAIAARGLASVEAIATATRAGTGCGSCISELKGFLRHEPAPAL